MAATVRMEASKSVKIKGTEYHGKYGMVKDLKGASSNEDLKANEAYDVVLKNRDA